jgi:hypothetical protein
MCSNLHTSFEIGVEMDIYVKHGEQYFAIGWDEPTTVIDPSDKHSIALIKASCNINGLVEPIGNRELIKILLKSTNKLLYGSSVQFIGDLAALCGRDWFNEVLKGIRENRFDILEKCQSLRPSMHPTGLCLVIDCRLLTS